MNDKIRAVPMKPRRGGFIPEEAPTPVAPANNMSATRNIGMTFNVDPDWHAEFKSTAAHMHINMKELLYLSFEAWKAQRRNQR